MELLAEALGLRPQPPQQLPAPVLLPPPKAARRGKVSALAGRWEQGLVTPKDEDDAFETPLAIRVRAIERAKEGLAALEAASPGSTSTSPHWDTLHGELDGQLSDRPPSPTFSDVMSLADSVGGLSVASTSTWTPSYFDEHVRSVQRTSKHVVLSNSRERRAAVVLGARPRMDAGSLAIAHAQKASRAASPERGQPSYRGVRTHHGPGSFALEAARRANEARGRPTSPEHVGAKPTIDAESFLYAQMRIRQHKASPEKISPAVGVPKRLKPHVGGDSLLLANARQQKELLGWSRSTTDFRSGARTPHHGVIATPPKISADSLMITAARRAPPWRDDAPPVSPGAKKPGTPSPRGGALTSTPRRRRFGAVLPSPRSVGGDSFHLSFLKDLKRSVGSRREEDAAQVRLGMR